MMEGITFVAIREFLQQGFPQLFTEVVSGVLFLPGQQQSPSILLISNIVYGQAVEVCFSKNHRLMISKRVGENTRKDKYDIS
jgi:hypothetical protein